MNKFPWSFLFVIAGVLKVSHVFAIDETQPEKEFKLINRIIFDTYKEEVANKFGVGIKLDERWSNFGSGFLGDNMLRFPDYFLMTLTGEGAQDPNTRPYRSLAACHEWGHTFGGAPYQKPKLVKWSSVEHRADEWAISECMWRYVEHERSLVYIHSFEPDNIQICEQFYNDQGEKKVLGCLRILSTIQALTNYFNRNAKPENQIKLFDRDTTVVQKTLQKFSPNKTCRIQTMVNALLFKEESPSCWFKAE